jgi:hypothetical protein
MDLYRKAVCMVDVERISGIWISLYHLLKLESEREVGEVILELTQRMPGFGAFWCFGGLVVFWEGLEESVYGITFVLEDDSTEICSLFV